MAYCEVEKDVRIYYEEWGSGSPFLFVHGGGMSHEAWEQQACGLAERFRVVTLDLRGHGASDKPPHGHTFERFTEDVEALVAHLGLRDIRLVCHGIGCYVGILLALKRPQLVSALVLASGGARFVGADAERGGFSTELWETYLAGMAKNKIEATAALIERTFFHRDPGAATRQAVLDIMLQWPLYATRLLGRDLEKLDLEPELGRIRAPTLVVHGRHDRKQRFSGAARLAGKIPGARLVVFEESAHNPQLEEVEKFNRLLTGLAVA
jgi:non-heme chloroperoxidase